MVYLPGGKMAKWQRDQVVSQSLHCTQFLVIKQLKYLWDRKMLRKTKKMVFKLKKSEQEHHFWLRKARQNENKEKIKSAQLGTILR